MHLPGPPDGMTEADYIDKQVAKWSESAGDLGTAASVRSSPTRPVLPSRYFRDAWKDNGATVEIDLPKARNIKAARVLAERDVRLTAINEEGVDADARGNAPDKAQVALKRQNLQDIETGLTAQLDAITDVNELEAFQPAWP